MLTDYWQQSEALRTLYESGNYDQLNHTDLSKGGRWIYLPKAVSDLWIFYYRYYGFSKRKSSNFMRNVLILKYWSIKQSFWRIRYMSWGWFYINWHIALQTIIYKIIKNLHFKYLHLKQATHINCKCNNNRIITTQQVSVWSSTIYAQCHTKCSEKGRLWTHNWNFVLIWGISQSNLGKN